MVPPTSLVAQQPDLPDLSGLSDLTGQLARHRVYERAAASAAGLRTFTEHHVFAVWDFMSLLKRLQRDLTGLSLPWLPTTDASSARLVHEIVLGEESDALPDGRVCSHVELYLDGMRELGADVGPFTRFLDALRDGVELEQAFHLADVPRASRAFVRNTLRTAENAPTHVVAAVFFHGRENLIPEMFRTWVGSLRGEGLSVDTLTLYLERHIELDGGEHGDWASALVERLCASDDQPDRTSAKRVEAAAAAEAALRARLALWDAVANAIDAIEA